MTTEMSNCPMETGRPELLLDFTAGHLDAARREPLARHVAHCAACQEWTLGQSQLWNALDEWVPEPVSADFDAKLLAKIAAVEQSSPWTRWRWAIRGWLLGERGWAPAVPLAVAALTIAVGIWIQNPWPGDGVQSATVSFEAKELEQAERALEDMEMLKVFDAAAVEDPTPEGQPL